MTKRDFLWLVIGWWCATGFLALIIWWQDVKTGVKHVESIDPLIEHMEQVEKFESTHQQLKATEDIRESAFIKHWSAVEKQLKVLQLELNRTNQALEQHKKEHAVMVASKPVGGRERLSGDYPARIQQRTDSLPAPQLIQLAREVGFQKVEVKP